ncbi:MAG: hypothetical protein ACM3TN_18510 [Alphaproteobacteria bacterium]
MNPDSAVELAPLTALGAIPSNEDKEANGFKVFSALGPPPLFDSRHCPTSAWRAYADRSTSFPTAESGFNELRGTVYPDLKKTKPRPTSFHAVAGK